MKEKANKEYNKNREFGVILEKVYSEVKIIAEGQSGLRDKLDSTMGMVAKNTEDITLLRILADNAKHELSKINGKLAKIEDDLRIIKEDFSKRLTRLEALK